jgi:hypothetical protein
MKYLMILIAMNLFIGSTVYATGATLDLDSIDPVKGLTLTRNGEVVCKVYPDSTNKTGAAIVTVNPVSTAQSSLFRFQTKISICAADLKSLKQKIKIFEASQRSEVAELNDSQDVAVDIAQ